MSLGGNLEAARAHYEEALDLFRTNDDAWGAGIVLANLLALAMARGDYDRAEALGEEALRLMRGWGDRFHAAAALSGLAEVAVARDQEVRATALFEEAAAERRHLQDRRGLADSLAGLAQLSQRRGERGRAAALLEEALALVRDAEDPLATADLLALRGDIAHEDGDETRAAAHYHESLQLWRQHRHPGGLVACIERIANLAATRGKHAQVAELTGAAEALRERQRGVWTEYFLRSTSPAARAQPMLAQRRSAALSTAWQAGKELSLDEAVARALGLAAELVEIDVIPPLQRQVETVSPSRLSARELEVLRLIAAGRTDRGIAEALFISRRTVTSHVSHILQKLALPSRTAAAAYAIRYDLA